VPLKKKEVKDDPKNQNSYREASCRTVSYLNRDGNRISNVRFARMPETKKRTLKAQLHAEFKWAMEQRPDPTVVKVRESGSCSLSAWPSRNQEGGV
jgi:hypothetical protein